MTIIAGGMYPRGLDDLLPAARDLAARLGQVPSRNRLMRELRIGAPKATVLREELEAVLDRPDPWQHAEPVAVDPVDLVVVPESPAGLTPDLDTPPTIPAGVPDEQVTAPGHPGTPEPADRARRPVVWPVILLALGAFVSVWSGWVGLGRMTGFGMVDLLPGIVEPGSWATIDSAITLPIGVEAYAAYALYVWLSGRVPARARRFARTSAIASLGVGALGQITYHLLVAGGMTAAPWQITTAVACLPVAVLGMGAALAHLVREGR